MTVIERILKRQRFAVPVGEETYYVHEMPVDELRQLEDIMPDMLLRSFYILGRSIVSDDPQTEIAAAETPHDYAVRMQSLFKSIGSATLAQLISAITKLGTTPSQETLRKN